MELLVSSTQLHSVSSIIYLNPLWFQYICLYRLCYRMRGKSRILQKAKKKCANLNCQKSFSSAGNKSVNFFCVCLLQQTFPIFFLFRRHRSLPLVKMTNTTGGRYNLLLIVANPASNNMAGPY